jgi:hypothetical protein
MPNFVLFGTAKAGTTSVYKYLEQHPDIYMSSAKEPGFFAFEGEKPIFNGRGAQKWVDRSIVTDLESYQALFTGYAGQKAIGEASPYYIYYPLAAERMHHYVPDIKLIAILRNPVDRAFSNYLMTIRDRAEPLKDFQAALAAELDRIKDNWGPKWHYKNQGFYYQQLQPYYEKFDPKQIKIYLYEDFIAKPIELVQNSFEFLEVDPTFVPNMEEKYNVSQIPRNQALHKFLNKPNRIKSLIKPFLPLKFRQNLQQQAKQKILFKPELKPSIRSQLIREYREDILKLQDLIQQDLSLWLKC